VVHQLISYAPLLLLLVWAAAVDLRRRRIPNWLTGLLILSGLAQSFLPGQAVTPTASLIGMLAGAGVPFLLFAIGAMGGGDVKLMAGIGAWLGPMPAFAVLVVEKILGLIIVITQAVFERQMPTLLRNSAVVAVNLLYVKDVGLDHAARTGRDCRSIRRPLPFAVPTLAAVVLVILKIGSHR
jgi:prepilin peptidase CpaA